MQIMLVVLTALSLAAAAIFAAAAWRARTEAAERSAARVAALASALAPPDGPVAEAPRPVPVASMFASATTESRALTRPIAVTAIAAVVLMAGGAILRTNAPPAAGVAPGAVPLELVSMRHVREGRTLTVTGLVRNPSNGAPLSAVAALVFAFDRGGAFVASGRGALELPVLQPGEEAPFAVTIADLPDIGRYRVSFRTPAGPLRHVDRRTARQLVSAP